jgi:hypothetical protein
MREVNVVLPAYRVHAFDLDNFTGTNRKDAIVGDTACGVGFPPAWPDRMHPREAAKCGKDRDRSAEEETWRSQRRSIDVVQDGAGMDVAGEGLRASDAANSRVVNESESAKCERLIHTHNPQIGWRVAGMLIVVAAHKNDFN